jgi:hypothetical protein
VGCDVELKKWNHLQMTAFDMCKIDIENNIDVYRYASLISEHRKEPCNLDTLQKIINKIKKEKFEKN